MQQLQLYIIFACNSVLIIFNDKIYQISFTVNDTTQRKFNKYIAIAYQVF